MKIQRNAFNTYLLVALCSVWLGGCASPQRSKDAPVVRVYLEVPRDATGNQIAVPIGRRPLFEVWVQPAPFLTEFHVKRVEVRDDKLGGYELVLEFNRQGRWLLDEVSTANKGRRAVVFLISGELQHFTAAPIIKDRIGNGIMVFTPDMTRSEAETFATKMNEEEAKQKVHDY